MNNAIDHSCAENIFLTVRQDYLKTAVTISDDGVEIFKKIIDYFDLNCTDDAICELMKGKLTTDSQNHSGECIFFSSKIMDRFYIYSDGTVFTGICEDKDLIINQYSGARTVVYMELSNFSNKKINEVFDLYSDVDAGFTKTRLLLCNAFPSAPVSRSQAKRVCNRLDNFAQIEFDFQGLTWMGQGFAHQVFVVFQNQHPDIKLIPVNMSEKIQKMYNHVIKSV